MGALGRTDCGSVPMGGELKLCRVGVELAREVPCEFLKRRRMSVQLVTPDTSVQIEEVFGQLGGRGSYGYANDVECIWPNFLCHKAQFFQMHTPNPTIVLH